MNWPLFSVIFMLVSFIVIIGVDVLLLTRKKKATFSEITRATARKWQPIVMILCFGFGMLSAHFFWGKCSESSALMFKDKICALKDK